MTVNRLPSEYQSADRTLQSVSRPFAKEAETRAWETAGASWPDSGGTSEADQHRQEVQRAVRLTRDWLLRQQHPDGYWVGELEGDTILESEYILLLAWLGRGQTEIAKKCARQIQNQQRAEGGWAMYPGGPLEVSGSVKAYWALKIAGHDPQAEYMIRARDAIRAAGGAEKVNSFTRYYLALLGVIRYQQCPAVPPELMLIPTRCPGNIYEMSAWSRTILVPLSLLWAYQPVMQLPEGYNIRELFLTSPEELPVCMPPAENLDPLTKKPWINWTRCFQRLDWGWKKLEAIGFKPLRKWAIQKAERWILERCANSDGLGAIFPPIIWTVVALRCLKYAEDSPEVQAALRELEKLTIQDGDTARLEPCRSPVWDTAIAIIALRDAGVPSEHSSLESSVQWLLKNEIRRSGDWAIRGHTPKVEPSGWCFEFRNEFYPDIDDTIMVLMAFSRCLPSGVDRPWLAELQPAGMSPLQVPSLATVIVGTTGSLQQAMESVTSMAPVITAMKRGVRWTLAMQCRNGGWGAFDADNDREILTRVPFADHNAMIDPATADITARTLEMLGHIGFDPHHPTVQRAVAFVNSQQNSDGSWYGRWGVNYIYGTWQVLVGLRAMGVAVNDPRLRAGAAWLCGMQQACGGWGESCASYDHPETRGQGNPTPSQTAWALLGLLAAGERHSLSVRRGIQYLLETQKPDGTWDETDFTGTGFPRVFYLRYHLYRISFPLMALARYAAVS